jgi:hypothetical protein
MSAFGQDIWQVNAEDLSHALKVCTVILPIRFAMLTSSVILDRLPILQSSDGNDESHHHIILHPTMSRLHAILPGLLGHHRHRLSQHHHFHVSQHISMHADTLELGPF